MTSVIGDVILVVTISTNVYFRPHFFTWRSGLFSTKRRDFYKKTDGFLTSVVFIYFGLKYRFRNPDALPHFRPSIGRWIVSCKDQVILMVRLQAQNNQLPTQCPLNLTFASVRLEWQLYTLYSAFPQTETLPVKEVCYFFLPVKEERYFLEANYILTSDAHSKPLASVDVSAGGVMFMAVV